jgi:hypothetical protein
LAFLTRCKRELSSTAFGYKNDEISYKLIKKYIIYEKNFRFFIHILRDFARIKIFAPCYRLLSVLAKKVV